MKHFLNFQLLIFLSICFVTNSFAQSSNLLPLDDATNYIAALRESNAANKAVEEAKKKADKATKEETAAKQVLDQKKASGDQGKIDQATETALVATQKAKAATSAWNAAKENAEMKAAAAAKIFAKYQLTLNQDAPRAYNTQQVEDNVFCSKNDLIKKQLSKLEQDDIFKKYLNTPTGDVASPNSGTDPLGAPLIDALATVIARRFKEEITHAFLKDFRELLNNDPHLSNLFPNAILVLANENIFDHKAWIGSLRGALDEDLRLLPEGLPEFLEQLLTNTDLDDKQKNQLSFLLSISKHGLAIAQNPDGSYQEIIGFLGDLSSQLDAENQQIKFVIELIRILLMELGNPNNGNWFSSNALENLNDPEVASNFIGFVIEKYRDGCAQFSRGADEKIVFSDQPKAQNVYTQVHQAAATINIEAYKKALQKVVQQVLNIQQEVSDLRRMTLNGSLGYKDYAPLFGEITNTIALLSNDEFYHLVQADLQVPSLIKQKIDFFTNSLQFASEIYTHISNKSYSKIIVSSLKFTDELLKKIDAKDSLKNNTTFQHFLKYTQFAINLASAQNSEELTQALETAILPTQSFRLKRQSKFSVSLNSYAGALFAPKAYELGQFMDTVEIPQFRPTATIGIGFNWALSCKKSSDSPQLPTKVTYENSTDEKKYSANHSISLYFPIVDVGAVSLFRLNNEEDMLENIQWRDVVSPGAFVVWGIGNTPLALGAGIQRGPSLSEIGDNGATLVSRRWRFCLNLTADIPFFHFYNRTEKVVFRNQTNKPRK